MNEPIAFNFKDWKIVSHCLKSLKASGYMDKHAFAVFSSVLRLYSRFNFMNFDETTFTQFIYEFYDVTGLLDKLEGMSKPSIEEFEFDETKMQ